MSKRNHEYIPVQVFMSDCNTYPSLHLHSWEPILFKHLWLQPPFSTLHSSTSEIEAIIIYYCINPLYFPRNSAITGFTLHDITSLITLASQCISYAGRSKSLYNLSLSTIIMVLSCLVDCRVKMHCDALLSATKNCGGWN